MKSKKKFRISLFTDRDGSARIRVKSKNNRIIMSSEAYSSPAKARQTFEALKAAVIFRDFDYCITAKQGTKGTEGTKK